MRARTVILMPSIERNAFDVDELLSRQDLYCSKLREFQGEAFEKPLIIFSGVDAPLSRFQNIEIAVANTKPISLISFVWLTRSILRRNSIPVKSYVAGTPFQPFLVSLLLQFFYYQAPIHTAIHGEVSALKSGGFLGQVKLQFLKVFIRRATSVRFVSQRQLVDAQAILPIDHVKTFVTPVPVLNTREVNRRVNPQTIAFVGRLQAERGVQEWIDIAKHFDEKKLVVIGDGPLLPMMKTQLPNAIFLGSLKNSEVQEAWSGIGVLLSAAPFESYGLAMQEALLHNVPVVSRRNVGSLELNDKFPNLVKIFNHKEEAVKEISEMLARKNLDKDFARFKSEFLTAQDETLVTLARMWSNEV